MHRSPPGIAIVTRPTRLERLKGRWGTVGQVAFRLKQAHAHEAIRRAPAEPPARGGKKKKAAAAHVSDEQADFEEYQKEDDTYQAVIDQLERDLDFGLPIKKVERSFLPNFDFGTCEVVVVVGQDGLVANAAKYVGSLPIVAVNPDPKRIDGVLMPFSVKQAVSAVKRVLDKKFQARQVTLAQALLNDGQKLLAFNDLFIGAASHISARYTLEAEGRVEPQSSSGVIVSTGVGSTRYVCLQVTSATQPPREFFRERDKSELEWLATVLSKGVGLPGHSKEKSAC